jgi:hypothetical protein
MCVSVGVITGPARCARGFKCWQLRQARRSWRRRKRPAARPAAHRWLLSGASRQSKPWKFQYRVLPQHAGINLAKTQLLACGARGQIDGVAQRLMRLGVLGPRYARRPGPVLTPSAAADLAVSTQLPLAARHPGARVRGVLSPRAAGALPAAVPVAHQQTQDLLWPHPHQLPQPAAAQQATRRGQELLLWHSGSRRRLSPTAAGAGVQRCIEHTHHISCQVCVCVGGWVGTGG